MYVRLPIQGSPFEVESIQVCAGWSFFVRKVSVDLDGTDFVLEDPVQHISLYL